MNFLEYKKNIADKVANLGVNSSQAETISDYMTVCDFFGITSHGARTLDAHCQKIQRGEYNLSPSFKVLKETPSFAVIDGDNAIGIVSAEYCVNYAVNRAKENGIFTVLSKNNNTFGAAFYYAYTMAKRGMLIVISSNSPAQMAPFGGIDKMLGTNPFAIGIPAEKNEPIVIDMATSVSAKSKFKEYKERGEKLPVGWALDKSGNPTTDPDEAIAGTVLPMAGFKGYGIALAIDVISGLLSGAAFLDGVGRFYGGGKNGMNVGYTVCAIDPTVVFGEAFYREVDLYIERIRSSTAKAGKQISLPGDDRLETYRKNMNYGIIKE